MRHCLSLACCLVCFSVATVAAQTPTPSPPDVASRWSVIFSQVIAEKKLTLLDASGNPATGTAAVRLSGKDEERRAAYEEAVRRLVADPQLASMFTPTPAQVEALISEQKDPSIGRFVQELAAQVPREKRSDTAWARPSKSRYNTTRREPSSTS